MKSNEDARDWAWRQGDVLYRPLQRNNLHIFRSALDPHFAAAFNLSRSILSELAFRCYA